MQPLRQSSLIPLYRAAVFQIKASAAVLLVVAASLVAACGGGPGLSGPAGGPSESDAFTLSGPVKADSGAGRGAGGGCQWTPAVFDLHFTSGQMQGGVQVRFDATVPVGGIGDVDAVQPRAADGSTPLQLVVAGKAIPAAQGTIHVTDADLSARRWKGSIDASFTDGTRLSGTWSCQAA